MISGILGLVAVLLSTSEGARWMPLVIAVIVFGIVAYRFYRHRRAILRGAGRKNSGIDVRVTKKDHKS